MSQLAFDNVRGMERNEKRTVAAAAALVGAAFAAGLAIKAQHDAEVGEWVQQLREARVRAEQLTRKSLQDRAQRSQENEAAVQTARKAYFAPPGPGLKDKNVESVHRWTERFVDFPDDRTTMNNTAKALLAVSRQGDAGMRYAKALVKALESQIAERRLFPPIGNDLG